MPDARTIRQRAWSGEERGQCGGPIGGQGRVSRGITSGWSASEFDCGLFARKI